MARSIWKGRLVIGKQTLPVKMYSALQDTKVHFHLLDKHGLAPVHQRIVRKSDHEEVPREAQRKAFPLDAGRAVVFKPEELEQLEPVDSRDIAVCRFIPPDLLSDEWYDRPYYVGPDNDKSTKAYFAFLDALIAGKVIGICRWVMRASRYVGALLPCKGYLMMITLRRAEQIVSVPELEVPQQSNEKEVTLARQLIDSIAGDFDPSAWEDEYHQRVCELIAAKEKGRKLEPRRHARAEPKGDLAAMLRQSIASSKEHRARA